MKNLIKISLIALSFLSLQSCNKPSGAIGNVVDATTGLPVDSVYVARTNMGTFVLTDTLGYFNSVHEENNVVLTYQKEGYITQKKSYVKETIEGEVIYLIPG